MCDGRFWFGVGSGERLNEHVSGARWPTPEVRLAMLEEAVQVIRALWRGETVDHHGRFYTVENARLFTLPETAPPIIVSALSPTAATTPRASATGCGAPARNPTSYKRGRTPAGTARASPS